MYLKNDFIKKAVLGFITTLSLFGCSNDDSSPKKGNDKNTQEQIQLRDTTDRSVCKSTSTQSDPRGSWEITQEGFNESGQSIKINIVLNFSGTIFKLESTCTFNKSYSITAEDLSYSTYDNNYIETFSNLSNTKESSDGNFKCSVALNKTKFKYKFEGACLVLSAPGLPEVLFIPKSL